MLYRTGKNNRQISQPVWEMEPERSGKKPDFYFGKLLFNEKIGLIASFLLSFFPLDIVYATKLNSDLPSSFFMALGVYLKRHLHPKMNAELALSRYFDTEKKRIMEVIF